MPLKQSFRVLFRVVGMDRPIAYVLLTRGWNTIAGVITLYMVAHYLRPVEQGFYFTFSSILGLQIFFELGFSYALMQCVSHERAHLSWTPRGTLEGSDYATARLSRLLKTALKWYGAAATLSFTVVLCAGLMFFQRSAANSAGVAWRVPWIWLAFAESAMMFTSPFFAFLEGAGLVAQVALVRLTTALFTATSLWLALGGGLALLASPIVSTVGVLSSAIWIAARWKRYFIDLLRRDSTAASFNWRSEILPFQWRIAVTWLSFYFMSQLAVPVLFRYRGPIVAGQMGLSTSMVLAMQAIGIAWMTTKAPRFGVFAARREFKELDALFSRTFRQALSVLLGCGIVLFGVVVLITNTKNPYQARILGPMAFAFLLGRMITDCSAYFMGVYLRAFKREPLLWVAVMNACLTAGGTYVFGRLWGADGVAIANFLASAISLPFSAWVFRQKRAQWRAESPGDPIGVSVYGEAAQVSAG